MYYFIFLPCQHINYFFEPSGDCFIVGKFKFLCPLVYLDNFGIIVQTALDAGVPKIIPHVYSSIMNDLGETKIEDVLKLKALIENLKY